MRQAPLRPKKSIPTVRPSRVLEIAAGIRSKIAASFTTGELAVLTVVGRQCQKGGACSLHIDAIAALAGVCRTIVKNALRAARAGGCCW